MAAGTAAAFDAVTLDDYSGAKAGKTRIAPRPGDFGFRAPLAVLAARQERPRRTGTG
jgi:hypothetical protein